MRVGRWRSFKQRVLPSTVEMNSSEKKKDILREISLTLESSRDTIRRKTAEYKKLFRRGTRIDFMYNGSFHEAVRPAMIISHVFSVMPVDGIKGPDAHSLSFSWSSPKTIYSTFVTFLLFIYWLMTIYYLFHNRLRLEEIDPLIFYGSICCVHYKFLQLARKWPQLMVKWHEIECKLPEHQSQWRKAALAHQIKMITLVILMMSLIEHLLSMITMIHYANYCHLGKEPVEEVLRSSLSQMFYITKYSIWKAIFGKILNVIATFVWNYMDLFVMIVSVGLSDKFRQVNASLMRLKGKSKETRCLWERIRELLAGFTIFFYIFQPTLESYWFEHRKHYRNLCNLCDEIDNAISFITMVSFSNNIYFICVQLLRSLNEMPSFAHALYFWYALVFLIGRTLAVSLYSAEINDESKKPVVVFRCVPKDSWCLELKRFSEEVTSGFVALSGMRFFHLTRNLVLSVAGTIVTYELVLIQFHVQETNVGCL